MALTFLTCNQSSNTLKVDNLKYSGFIWHLDDSSDTYKFNLVHFIEIDKSGNFNAVRVDSQNGTHKYFSGNIEMELFDKLNATNLKEFNSDYTWSDSCSIMYHGLSYCIDYQIGGNDHTIQFIPPCCPKKMNQIKTILDSVINGGEFTLLSKISLDDYIQKLKEISYSKLPPIPQKPPPTSNDGKLFSPERK